MQTQSYKPANLDNKTVQKILGAALGCWTRAGYHGASLKEIADEAGVAKSLLHYHFASKEHLLIELQSVYSRQVAASVRKRLATETPSLEAGLKALDQVWDAIVATRAQFPFALEVWRASLNNEAVRERMHEFEEELLGLFKEGVVTALGPVAGQLRLPPDRLAEMLQVALCGFELRLFINPDVARLRRVYDDFKMLVQLALLPQGGPS
jgi:TetR/AcrR family transcriptional regulator, repressor for uid operon